MEGENSLKRVIPIHLRLVYFFSWLILISAFDPFIFSYGNLHFQGENGCCRAICWFKAKLGHRANFRKCWCGCMAAELASKGYDGLAGN